MIEKTDKDIECETIAHGMNEMLISTPIHVTGGGRRGPYTVTIDRLSRKKMFCVIEILKALHNHK